MADAMLEEIWRVRRELLEKHGGLDGLFKHAQKLDRERRQRDKRKKAKKAPTSRVKRGR